ncbi:MAG: CDP-alcohol phosphatidyltransferase family protein [Patescibacteria group bacterium]|nr:CDP-alcohol phosphatidyltransferase family protein [bacterium]MDZ4240839.1 CDP-alcohol phosphatidyltransferase family protein [Patescibacteria group bacterium]
MEATFKTEISPKITVFDRILRKTLLKLIPYTVTPNAVTVFRFMTIPFVVYFLYNEFYFYGSILFLISALSDAVDGALARTRNQITEWGKMYDPFADKLLVVSSTLILLLRYTHAFLAWAIAILELFIVISAVYRRMVKHIPVQAHVTGKIKMVLQCVGLCTVLLYVLTSVPILFSFGIFTLYLALFFGFISLFVYYSA